MSGDAQRSNPQRDLIAPNPDAQAIVPHTGLYQPVDDVMAGASNGKGGNGAHGPMVIFPGDREGPCEDDPWRYFFIHAPQYNWTQVNIAGDNYVARSTIELLDHTTFRFGRIVERQLEGLDDAVAVRQTEHAHVQGRMHAAEQDFIRLQTELSDVQGRLRRL